MAKLKLKIKIKRILFDIIKIACVGALVIISIQIVPPLFKQKTITPKTEITKVNNKEEITGKKGSIDVLMIGNSSVYSGFNPLQMWKEHGYTSFAAAAPMQHMCLSYYTLKEILTVQTPKVLLLDISNLFESRGTSAVKENLKSVYTYSYPLFRDTSRWDEMESMGVVETKSKSLRLVARGYYYSKDEIPNTKGFSYMEETREVEELPSYTVKYLPKIMELAKQNDISVVFTSIPCSKAWDYKKHNRAVKVAKEYNVDFIDMNLSHVIKDLNWNTDSRDKGNHLNYKGAKKVTKYIGDYLKENYELTDYRGNENFKDWDEDYEMFMQRIK
ncbi:MAG: hypothetical protein RR630_09555 [Coprobacillus sp.]